MSEDGPSIRELDPTTVERIAAGEVVERPASVVKELVENSLDADADRVDVTVEAGGTETIRVSDDGVGMSESAVRKAVEKHTTSKIRDVDDLEGGVGTLGFRGEALHAIGAVSRMTVTTRPRGGGRGTELTVEGGDVTAVEPAGCPEGTTVEVRDLFYNVPARRKYLKRESTEFAHVNTVVTSYALANPEASVSLTHDGRETFATTGQGDLRETVMSVYGREVAESMIPVEVTFDDDRPLERIHGLVSHPETNRAGREYLSTYVNGRYVTANAVRNAVVDAYGTQLAPDRYPFAVLFLEVPAGSVDVNVHPRKLEVRFADEEGLRQQVTSAVEGALLEEGLVRTSAPRGQSAPDQTEIAPGEAGAETTGKAGEETTEPADTESTETADSTDTAEPTGSAEPEPDGPTAAEEGDASRSSTADTSSTATDTADTSSTATDTTDTSSTATDTTDDPSSTGASDPSASTSTSDASSPATSGPSSAAPGESSASSKSSSGAASGPEATPDARPLDSASGDAHGRSDRTFAPPADQQRLGDAEPGTGFESLPSMRILGQLSETYVVAETDDGLALIDQHAADERVNYERLKERFEGETTTQALAEPVRLELTAREAALLEDNGDALARLGFRASLVDDGDRRVAEVTTVPSLVADAAGPELIQDVLSSFVEGEAAAAETVEAAADALLSDLACYPSITGNTSLTEGSIIDLLEALDDCENPYACPHGRPVVIEIDGEEIENRFERDYPGHDS